MRGSIVEIVASRGCVEFLLSSPSGAREMHWVNGQAVAREYRCFESRPVVPSRSITSPWCMCVAQCGSYAAAMASLRQNDCITSPLCFLVATLHLQFSSVYIPSAMTVPCAPRFCCLPTTMILIHRDQPTTDDY